MSALLYGVGLGPGDPELITRKAARLIACADVVAYHSGTHGRSIARSIAAELLPPGVIEEALVYPVTTQRALHPGGYQGAMTQFYDESAQRLAVHLTGRRLLLALDTCAPADRWWCCARATRCSTGRTCICTTGCRRSSRPRWCRE